MATDSTTFGNNAPAWDTNNAIGTAVAPVGNADFRSTAYGELVTNEIRSIADHGHTSVKSGLPQRVENPVNH